MACCSRARAQECCECEIPRRCDILYDRPSAIREISPASGTMHVTRRSCCFVSQRRAIIPRRIGRDRARCDHPVCTNVPHNGFAFGSVYLETRSVSPKPRVPFSIRLTRRRVTRAIGTVRERGIENRCAIFSALIGQRYLAERQTNLFDFTVSRGEKERQREQYRSESRKDVRFASR